MRISVVGTGYVGLVSGACLAEKGHQVICVDVDDAKVDQINRGIAPIYEKNLEPLLKKNVPARLTATNDLENAVRDSELSLIAVGTPYKGDAIDLSYVENVCRQIGDALSRKSRYHMVVVKSTVVPGTTDEVVIPALESASGKKAGKDFGVGMNPEFLREGEAVDDFLYPDRIVLGGLDEMSLSKLEALYEPFEGVEKVKTNTRTAEMIKYTANSLLATMISFSNEIANLCSDIGGIDVVEVMRGVHLDKRLTPILPDGRRIVPDFTTYLEAGCGFGGSCFPKDVKALISHGKKNGNPMMLLDSVVRINAQQPNRIVSLLKKHFQTLRGLHVGVLGLAFKPGTDDMRESPAIPIVEALINEDAQIRAFDPVATDSAKQIFASGHIRYCEHVNEAIDGTDAVLLLTRWPEFINLPEMIGKLTKPPLVIDGRRMLDKTAVKRYDGIGL